MCVPAPRDRSLVPVGPAAGRGGKAQIAHRTFSPQDSLRLPSCPGCSPDVAFTDSERLIGDAAKNQVRQAGWMRCPRARWGHFGAPTAARLPPPRRAPPTRH